MTSCPTRVLHALRKALQRRSVRLIIGIVLLWGLLRLIDFEQTWAAMRDVRLWGFLVLVCLFYIAHTLAAYRWKILLRVNGVNISLWDAFRLNLLAMFTSCFLPGSVGGDALKMAILAGRGKPLSRVIAASVMDRLLNTAVVTIWAAAMLPRVLLIVNIDWQPLQLRAPDLLPIVAIAILAMVILAFIAWHLTRKRADFRRRAAVSAQEILMLAREWKRQPGTFALAAAVSAIMFALLTGGPYGLLRALDVSVTYADMLTVFLALHFISIVPVSINGLGITEISLVLLLGTLGVPANTATAFAILYRAVSFLCLAPAGLLYVKNSQERERQTR